MTLAYPGPPSAHSESFAIRSFIDALTGKTLVTKIRERKPTSLDNAYKVAIRLKGYRKADEDSDGHSERRPGRMRADKEKELTNTELVRRIEQLETNQTTLGV